MKIVDLIWVLIMTYHLYKYTKHYTKKSHWLHYEIDYVNIDKFLNNEQNGDTVWLHVLSGFTGIIALFELNLSYRTF